MTAPMRWLGAGRRSITFRITLVFALITTAVLLGLGLLIGQAVEQHFVEQDMDQLEGKTHLAGHLLAQAHTHTELKGLAQGLNDSLVGHHGLALAVVLGATLPAARLSRRAAALASAASKTRARLRARASISAFVVRSTLPSHLAVLPPLPPSMAVTRRTDSGWR